MTEDNTTKGSLMRKAYSWRRWGLVAIVLGLLVLLQDLFGPDAWPWTAPILLLVFLVQPRNERPASWMPKFGGIIIIAAILAAAEVGLAQFRQFTSPKLSLVLAAACLGLGIILQLLGERYAFRSSFALDQYDPLLEKIRRL